MMTSAQATGEIRLYQTVVGGILLLNAPVSFLVLSVWRQPTLVLWVSIALVSSALIARLFILRRLTGLAVGYYIRRVISRVVLVGSVATLVNHLMVFQGASGISLVAG